MSLSPHVEIPFNSKVTKFRTWTNFVFSDSYICSWIFYEHNVYFTYPYHGYITRPWSEYVKKTQGIRKTRNWFRYETFNYVLSLRFFDIRRERHSFFNKCAAHSVDPNWSRRGETKNRLPSSRLESQLSLSEFKSQLTVFFFKFQNPQHFRAWHHSRPRAYFLSGFFIVTSLIVTSAPRVREPLQSMCAPKRCTKRKVLSLSKPKGKIYKTKSLRKYNTA